MAQHTPLFILSRMCKADHFNVGSKYHPKFYFVANLSELYALQEYIPNKWESAVYSRTIIQYKTVNSHLPAVETYKFKHKNTDGLLPKIWVRVKTRCWDHQVSFICLRIIKEPEKRIHSLMMLYWNMCIFAATEVNVKLGVVVNDITIIILLNYWIVYGANAWSNSSALLQSNET